MNLANLFGRNKAGYVWAALREEYQVVVAWKGWFQSLEGVLCSSMLTWPKVFVDIPLDWGVIFRKTGPVMFAVLCVLSDSKNSDLLYLLGHIRSLVCFHISMPVFQISSPIRFPSQNEQPGWMSKGSRSLRWAKVRQMPRWEHLSEN